MRSLDNPVVNWKELEIVNLQRSASVALLMGIGSGAAFGVDVPRLTLDNTSAGDDIELIRGTPRNTDYAIRATLYWENDGGWAKPIARTDHHYTAGVGASLAWQAPWVDAILSKVPTICGEFDPVKSDYAMG